VADFQQHGAAGIVRLANESTAGIYFTQYGKGKFTELDWNTATALGEDGHEQAAGMAWRSAIYAHGPAFAGGDGICA